MGGYAGGMGSMYGGMGGMGGMGGYGSMYGGGMGGGMYGGMGGMQGDPNDPNNLTNGFTQSTQATFQIIESIVGAFGGFAQMLESTYMATHSSFFGKSPYVRSRTHLLITTLSYGIGCRAIRKSPKYLRLDTRNLHNNEMATNIICQNYGPAPASRCYIPHTLCICLI